MKQAEAKLMENEFKEYAKNVLDETKEKFNIKNHMKCYFELVPYESKIIQRINQEHLDSLQKPIVGRIITYFQLEDTVHCGTEFSMGVGFEGNAEDIKKQLKDLIERDVIKMMRLSITIMNYENNKVPIPEF